MTITNRPDIDVRPGMPPFRRQKGSRKVVLTILAILTTVGLVAFTLGWGMGAG